MRPLDRCLALLALVVVCFAGHSLSASDSTEKHAVALIRERGGKIHRDSRSPRRPIVKVDFSGSRIDAATLGGLSALADLKILCLGHTNVRDENLLHLQELKGLTELALYETAITDAGLQHIKCLTSLEKLHLGHTRITDAGLDSLKGLVHLRYLALGRTRVTDQKIRELAKSLPECTISHPASMAANTEP
jgi:hypothetical protein